LAGAITPDELHRALGYYTNNAGYLLACKEGAARYGLDGNPAGSVSADEAAHAAEKLAALSARAAGEPQRSAVQTAKRRRLSLSDLRAAALARKVRA
jgi:ProP effector